MKRIAVIMIFLAMFVTPSYSEDDDSTPYMPYPERPQTQPTKPAPKKTPAKKPAPKKKTTVKKSAPKKTTPKTTPAKPSSLQQAIDLINQGRYNEAKPYLLNAINANKNDPNVWYWYGVWHEKLGCFHEAQYFYTKALQINPSFEPLSRVVYYPEDPAKIPLWDPKRPARVYPVETGNKNFTTVPPMARDRTNLPNAPDDPVIPKVPVYTPPEPGSNPLNGDSWSPSVYVPPSPNNPTVPNGSTPVYTPPQGPIEAEHRESIEIDISRREPTTITETNSHNDRDRIIRVDLPLYTPPEPGQRIAAAPTTQKVASEPKVTEQPKKTTSSTQPKKQPAVPRKVVRQTKTTPPKTTRTARPSTTRTTRTVSPDVRPVQTPQPRPQPQPQVQQEITPVQIAPEQPAPRQETRQEYMPPIGQYAPDPGTISEAPIPPVGQGNQD